MSKQTADGRNVHDDASSILAPGTLCTVIAGCPENIGLVVEVVSRLGAAHGYRDGYPFQTEYMAATMFPGNPEVMNTPEEVVATLTPHIAELEGRLAKCLCALQASNNNLPR